MIGDPFNLDYYKDANGDGEYFNFDEDIGDYDNDAIDKSSIHDFPLDFCGEYDYYRYWGDEDEQKRKIII